MAAEKVRGITVRESTMSNPLLVSKVHIPAIRPELVPRPRLIERLNAGLGQGGFQESSAFAHKLTLVSAPAGFGKTTLLSEWAASVGRHGGRGPREPPVRFAWLSLDSGDDEPARFWAYLIAALQTIPSLSEAGVGDAALAVLRSPRAPGAPPPPVEALLSGLINEIDEIDEPIALILDDFHLISERQIHQGITFLLDNAPSPPGGLHLILSTRADPPWPLARRRARGELVELRIQDLRFTPQEAAAFLKEVMVLDLSPEDVATLETRTEGWVAGLQMAALSMRGRKDAAAFIAAFGGTHRFILDYLLEEVLDGQSPAIQDFLLKTSILERMTAPLCDAVTDGSDSGTILTQLDRANLFLIPLDSERRWYRYHHLFADLMRSRLQQIRPGQAAILHRRASEWCEGNGLITEAVSHALAAGELEQVARLVEGNALAMIGLGELTTVTRWLDALPAGMVRSRPWLSIARAWALLYAGQLHAIEPLLQDAEDAARPLEEPGQTRHIAGHIAAIRAEAAYVRGEMSRTVALSHDALDCLPADDLMARSFAAAHLAYALFWTGDLAAADRALADAYALAQATGDSHITVTILCDQATVQFDRGQLHRVVDTIKRALQLANEYAGRGGQRLPSSGHAYTYIARVMLEWNDLPGALRYAQEGNELCQLWRQPETLTTSYAGLARVLQAMGETQGALDAMQQARRLAADLPPWIKARVAAQEALVRLAGGDLRAADRWRQESGLNADDQPTLQQRFLYRTLARVLIALGREPSNARLLEGALGLLSRLLETAEPAGAMGTVIEVLVLQAMALQAQGKVDQALPALERALSLAEPEGYVRTFIEEGAPMADLLRQTAARGITPQYVGRLLAALGGTPPASPAATLIEPLSKRELEVLRLLTTPMPHTEIAAELYVSVNTVRTHIKNIYSKLDVHSRMEAVQQAEELGLV